MAAIFFLLKVLNKSFQGFYAMYFSLYDETKALRLKLSIAINDLNNETLSLFLQLESFMSEKEIVKIAPPPSKLVRGINQHCEGLKADVKEYLPKTSLTELWVKNSLITP